MNALFYILLLLPPVAVAWVIWSYRRRAAEKDALSRERAAMLLVKPAPAGSAPATAEGRAEKASPGASAAVRPAVVATPPVAMRRERFLSQAETLVYYVLKSGLPGHEVFSRVSLASLVTLSGTAAPDAARAARYELDFILCEKSSLRVAAVVFLVEAQGAVPPAWVGQYLRAAGIRLVHVDPSRPPRREHVAQLVAAPDQ